MWFREKEKHFAWQGMSNGAPSPYVVREKQEKT
jgi:hypothetical protein